MYAPLVRGSNAFQSVLELFTAAAFHSSEVWSNATDVHLNLKALNCSGLSLNFRVTLYNCLQFSLPMQDLYTTTASSLQQILLLALISVGVVITLVVVTTIIIGSAQ